MPDLFAYGTLQDTAVQRSLFGRTLRGTRDRLPEFELRSIRLGHHGPDDDGRRFGIVSFTGNPSDHVDGTVLELTDSELARADAYEPAEYCRILVPLESGSTTWVYADSQQFPSRPLPAMLIADAELARRSILGYGELLAVLGRSSAGPAAEVRRPDVLGARIDAAGGSPFFNAAVVPPGVAPPPDDDRLPLCVWTVAGAMTGRVENPDIAFPVMGVALDDPRLTLTGGATAIDTPPLAVLGDINERAYGETGWFTGLVETLHDERIGVFGLRDGNRFVCVAMTMDVGEDLSIHYVATEASHRGRGLASSLVRALMAGARDRGIRSATLQASPDGLPVWKRLGFRTVATLRGFLRPD